MRTRRRTRTLAVHLLAHAIILLLASVPIASTSKAQSVSPAEALPMKICVICEPCPATYVSGLSNRIQTLLKYLVDQSNDSIEIITAEVVHPSPPSMWHGIPIHYTRGIPLPGYALFTLAVDWTAKLWRVVWKMRPDLIHCTSPGVLILPAIFCARVLQIPIVTSYHTHLPIYVRTYLPRCNRITEWFIWKLIYVLHSFSDLTLLTSPQILEQFEQRGIPRCELWQKGVDTSTFSPDFYSKKMRNRMSGGNPNNFLLVYVGRLAKEKRLKELRDIIETVPNARLCIVGTGPHEQELREYFNDTPTVFMGELRGTELSQTFASGDCFVMPSDSETLGFVVLESMASGVPCVGANAGGIPHIIKDGETGFLVPAGDIQAYVDRISRLQKDGKVRRAFSEAARADTKKWDWDASMARVRQHSYIQAREYCNERWERKFLRCFSVCRCNKNFKNE